MSAIARGLSGPPPAGAQPFTVCTRLYTIGVQYEFQMGYVIGKPLCSANVLGDALSYVLRGSDACSIRNFTFFHC